jgi:hypothetical protein
MACGIIPSSFAWSIPDLLIRNARVPVEDQLVQAFSVFNGIANWDIRRALRAQLAHRHSAEKLRGFTDILGLWYDWLPMNGTHLNIVDNPFPFPVTSMGEIPESRAVWKLLLKRKEATLTDTQKRVLQFYEDWEKHEPMRFYEYYRVRGNFRTDKAMMAFFQSNFDASGVILVDMELLNFYDYPRLVSAHMKIGSESFQQAEENIQRDGKGAASAVPGSNATYEGRTIYIEAARQYAQKLGDFVRETKGFIRKGVKEDFFYEDAWWLMMMRLHCWTMGITLVDREGVKIPSEYYNNPTRVYIL